MQLKTTVSVHIEHNFRQKLPCERKRQTEKLENSTKMLLKQQKLNKKGEGKKRERKTIN